MAELLGCDSEAASEEQAPKRRANWREAAEFAAETVDGTNAPNPITRFALAQAVLDHDSLAIQTLLLEGKLNGDEAGKQYSAADLCSVFQLALECGDYKVASLLAPRDLAVATAILLGDDQDATQCIRAHGCPAVEFSATGHLTQPRELAGNDLEHTLWQHVLRHELGWTLRAPVVNVIATYLEPAEYPLQTGAFSQDFVIQM